jgi:hypothetical protein
VASQRFPPAPAGVAGRIWVGRRVFGLSVVEQVAQGEQAAAGAFQDRDAGRTQRGGGGRVDGGGQPGEHRDRLGGARGGGQHRPRVGLVAVELGHQVDGQRDRGHGRVVGQRRQALGEQRLGVAAGPPHVERVVRRQAGVERRRQPVPGRRAEGGEGHAEFGGQVSDVRTFQAGIVHGGDARRSWRAAAAGPASARPGSAGPASADREKLKGVGQLGQVADAVQPVGAGQRLPRAVGRGQRAGVRRHQRFPGRRRAHAEQHGRHVRGQRFGQDRAQVRRVPDRLEDQRQHPGLRQAQRVPGVGRGGGDQLLAGRDGQAEAEAAARAQQRGEHRTRVGDQRDRPWVQVGLEIADGAQPAGDVHESHAPRAAHRHARLAGDRR